MGNYSDFLPYLKLFHDESPRDVLDQFYSLLEKQPEVTLRNRPEEPEGLEVEDFLSFEPSSEEFWEDFVRWWIAQYRREIVRKYDSLTGLYNRSHWNRRLRNEYRNPEDSYAVILGDVDHFKQFNDKFGHSTGDDVLRAVGEVLRNTFLPEGTCVRYGGEEFLIILSDDQEAMDRAEEFRQSVQGTLYDEQPEEITVSLGISLPTGENSGVEERIDQADLALYASKSRGRNCVSEYLPYMEHREALSVWGFYRYFWGSGLRFTFAGGSREFYVFYNGALRRYRWNKNRSSACELPGSVSSVRSLEFFDDSLILLDGEGRVWMREGGNWLSIGHDDAPEVTSVFGNENELYGAGINNQLYQIEERSVHRVGSLPDGWERTIYLGGPLVVSNGTLRTHEESPDRWSLPEDYVDFAGGDEKLVMSSTGGNLYVFDRELNHWKELRLPDFLNDIVRARNIDRAGKDLLIHDDNGRFFLASRSYKSVPQQMDLGL